MKCENVKLLDNKEEMNNKIAILLADGFEEIEAITPIDILRRLEFDLLIAGFADEVVGGHNLKIKNDVLIENLDCDELSAIILPGGLPGATNLRDSQIVVDLIKNMNDQNKIVAAICAAPIALCQAGIMTGKTSTGYPMELIREALSDANYTSRMVERDGNIITGKGPGASFEFSVEIAKALGKEAKMNQLKKMMYWR
jgi:protein deglycase